jgi:hypothetical protein
MTMAKFSKTLQDRARQLAAGSNDTLWDPSIPATVRREIALAVDQVNRQKESHDIQLRQLLQMECSVGTDLMELEQRIPWYTTDNLPGKDTLKQRLFDIEKDRRKLDQKHQEKLHALEDRILNLIHKHQQLDT